MTTRNIGRAAASSGELLGSQQFSTRPGWLSGLAVWTSDAQDTVVKVYDSESAESDIVLWRGRCTAAERERIVELPAAAHYSRGLYVELSHGADGGVILYYRHDGVE